MTNVRVDDLPGLFESLAREVMKEHEKRFLERSKGVREASGALDFAASRFEVAVKNAWGTMDKSASEYGTRMSQTIEELTRKLNRQQTSGSYDDVGSFHKASIDTLNGTIKTVRKYVPKLRRGLRVEMAALNVALGKLELAVRALGLALDQSPGSKVELARRDIVRLEQLHADLLKLRAEEVEKVRSLEAQTLQEKDVLKKSEAFTSNDTFLELSRYEESLRKKEEEIKQFLQPITKPLSKLERTTTSKKNQTINVETLRGLLDTPVQTVTAAQPFALIELVNQLGDALAQGRLEIEERRRRRAEETIQQVREGALEKLHGDYLTIQANVQETLRQLRASGLLDKKEELDRTLSEIRDETSNLTSEIVEIRRRIETLTTTMLKEKASIEQRVEDLTGKPLTIQTE